MRMHTHDHLLKMVVVRTLCSKQLLKHIGEITQGMQNALRNMYKTYWKYGGKAAKKTERNLFDVWSQQARTNRVPKHYTKWSFDIRAPPKCRLCSQRSEHGSSLVSLTGSTWRQEDVVLLEPFWDSCDAMACQIAWFRSNAP